MNMVENKKILNKECVKHTKIKADAVIFDMDGTLMDSMWLWKEIDISYLKKFGIKYPEGLQEGIAGKSFHETAVYFKDRFKIEDDIEKMKQDWNDMAYDLYKHKVFMKPGALDFIKKLKNNNIKLGIATSNSIELTNVCLNANKVEDYFDVVLTGSEIIKGKPDPFIYEECARRLKVNNENCVVFEDIVSGIEAGINAGMYVIGIDDDFSKEELSKKRQLADLVISDFTEIYDLF